MIVSVGRPGRTTQVFLNADSFYSDAHGNLLVVGLWESEDGKDGGSEILGLYPSGQWHTAVQVTGEKNEL